MPAQPTSSNARLGAGQRRRFPTALLLLAAGVLLSCWAAGSVPFQGASLALAQAPQAGPVQVVKTADPTFFVASGGQVQFSVRIDNTSSTLILSIDTLVDSIHGNLNGQGTCTTPQTIQPLSSYECSFAAAVSGPVGYVETDVVIATGSDSNQAPISGSASASVSIIAPPSTATRTPTATSTPVCPADEYEVDNSRDLAKPLPSGDAGQLRTFSYALDTDWVSIDTPRVGKSYNVRTFDLRANADTYIALYDKNGTFLRANDDLDTPRCLNGEIEYCQSSITWVASNTGPYYVVVRTLVFPQDKCPSYRIAARFVGLFLPVAIAAPPTPTPPATPTVTATATHTATSTWTPTSTRTPTATATPTFTRTPTRTPTNTRTATATPSITPTPSVTPTPSITPTRTNTPTPGPTDTPRPTATPTATADPSVLFPDGLAVDPRTHQVFVASRDNNRLFVLDGANLTELVNMPVGLSPLGVAVNPATDKAYVTHWNSRDVYVLNATTRAVLDIIPVGPYPTFVKINPQTNRVFVAKYSNNGLVIIDGDTNDVEASVGSGGVGTWGLAVNPNLNRVYLGNRDSGTVTTLDGNNTYQVLDEQTIKPCGGTGSAPYAMDFNPTNNKLYIACSPFHNVDSAAVYSASATGLTRVAFFSIGDGGDAGGGGVVVNTATGNVFFTNSRANTVSVVGGSVDRVLATIPAGANPYGAAADPGTNKVFVGNRDSHNVTILSDTYTP